MSAKKTDSEIAAAPAELSEDALDDISGGPTGDIEVTSFTSKLGGKDRRTRDDLITLPDAQEVIKSGKPS